MTTEETWLVMLAHGPGTSVLIGHHTAEAAASVLAYHLDRILGVSA